MTYVKVAFKWIFLFAILFVASVSIQTYKPSVEISDWAGTFFEEKNNVPETISEVADVFDLNVPEAGSSTSR